MKMVTLEHTGGDFRLTPAHPRTHTVHGDRLLLDGVWHTVTSHAQDRDSQGTETDLQRRLRRPADEGADPVLPQ